MKLCSYIVAVYFSCLLFVPSARAQSPNDILVIANKTVANDSITKDDLRDIFLKKRTSWPDGGKAVPINTYASKELRRQFRQLVLGMSAQEEANYWQDAKVKSGVREPATLGNALKAVFRIKGAVAYMYRRDYKSGAAKVVLVIPTVQ